MSEKNTCDSNSVEKNIDEENIYTDDDDHHHHHKLTSPAVTDVLYDMQDLSTTNLVECPDEQAGSWIDWRTLWSYMGPGWLMSLAYLDPGNLEADLQQGAYTGYKILWVLFWCTCMGLFLQVLAARLGVVTGKHLAQMCVDPKHGYSRPVAMALWVCTELAIIGSDVQEVVGSAIAFKILFGFPLWVGALITACDTFTFLGLHAFGVRKLEAFIAVLIGTMCGCFWVTFVLSKPNVGKIFEGIVVPSAEPYMANQAVGTIGAVIMPHNIFLHSALVLSRQLDRKKTRKVAESAKYNAIESSLSLLFSFVINVAVVGTYAATFYKKECANEDGGPYAWVKDESGEGTCQTIGLADTQDALTHTLGKSAKFVWAFGLLAAGQASTMTGTFAGQYVMEGFIQMKVAAWKRLAVTRSIALVPSVLVAIAASHNQSTSDNVDEWLNILQSVQLPFALLPVLHFTSSEAVMGTFKNSRTVKLIGWILATVVIMTNFYILVQFIVDQSSDAPHTTWFYVVAVLFFIGYAVFLSSVIRPDFVEFLAWARGGASKEESSLVSSSASTLSSLSGSNKAPLIAKEEQVSSAGCA